jgi:hypothetical protein
MQALRRGFGTVADFSSTVEGCNTPEGRMQGDEAEDKVFQQICKVTTFCRADFY